MRKAARTAIYTRISLDKSGQQLGVARQLQDCTALAQRLGWRVVATYDDNDLSAYNGKTRPRFEAMLDAMKRGEFDALICWHTDRLYRSLKDFARLIDIAQESRVDIRTVNGGDLDLSTASGKMLATILGSVAINESEHKAERQRRAARQKAERGVPQWRRAFGYLGDTYEPDPAVAPLVAEAYAAVLAGASLGDIARSWNDAGALTQDWRKHVDPETGERTLKLERRPWTQPAVSDFLRNPRNAGLRAHRGEIVGQGTWTPLISESTWRAAQQVLNAAGRAPGRRSVRKHLLTGVLVCGKCGGRLAGQLTLKKPKRSTVTGKRWATEEKAITYQCRDCHGVGIRAENIEPMVYEIVAGRLAMPDAVDLLKAELHDEAEAEAIRLELQTLYGELEKIGIERGQRLLTGQQAKIATDLINEDIAKLERRQQDQERLRVFDGLPLGTPEVTDAIQRLSPDRFRAVLDVLMTLTVAPVGKGGRVFNPERVQVNWR